jgi:4-aminobutyrate aminotransferase-like enzyme
VNTGHCHPRIMEAVRKQLDCFTHTCRRGDPRGPRRCGACPRPRRRG